MLTLIPSHAFAGLLRRLRWTTFLVAAVTVGFSFQSACAYVFEGPRWPANTTIVMNLELGATPKKLSDGFSSWDASAQDALNLWNRYLKDGVQFQPVPGSGASNAPRDGVNTVSFSDTVFGQSFGSDTLAVTTYYTAADNTFTEADVVFNNAKTWDSYRGNLRYNAQKQLTADFHRVAIHEFGHVLGLGHPGQLLDPANPAIMIALINYLDTLQQDDIEGVETLYSRPPVGGLVKTYDIRASSLLVDPSRSRLYVTVPADRTLAVIDTNSLGVIASIPIGNSIGRPTLSPDNSRLYIAGYDSQLNRLINVIDLDRLTLLSSLSMPLSEGVYSLVAGLDNRLFLAASSGLYQFDVKTGALLGKFADFPISSNNGNLVVSPDYRTLYFVYFNDYGERPNVTYAGTIVRFDVTTPAVRLRDQYTSQDFMTTDRLGAESLVFSHNGQGFAFYTNVLPSRTEGVINVGPSTTALLSTADFSFLGGFSLGVTSGSRVAFSPDDGVVYRGGEDNQLQIFSATTFRLLGSFPLPKATFYGDYRVRDLAAVNSATGSYLFVADMSASPLRVFSTPTGTTAHPPFFNGEVALSNGVYYLAFPANGNMFGYYSYAFFPYLFHFDLGFEYFIDAQDGQGGAFLYDFASASWFYTSPTFPFPYLYDFSLGSFLYYYPDTNNPGFYTKNPRYFFNFRTNQTITK